jgi:CDP-4-dehydro-6-deoxyglucose reductase, E3
MDNALLVSAAHRVTLKPGDRCFEVQPGETVLAAALRNGHALAHSCRSGVCGTCKAKVLEGAIDAGEYQPAALSAAEREQGYALLCQARARSALTLECAASSAADGIPVRKLVGRVQELQRMADDVMRIRLKLPLRSPLKFLAGQYVTVVINAAIRRSVSIATSPAHEDSIELHLRNYGGPLSDHVFTQMKENDLVRLEGPLGTFFVRAESAKPIIFVASGTGFAPIKAMIENELQKQSGRSMTLYWGGRRPRDLYLDGLVHDWVREHGVKYVPVVSDALPEDRWEGRTGFVHRAVIEDHPDLSGHQVYACGAPVVVRSARDDFTSVCRLPADEFHADMFVPSAGATPTCA